VPLKLNDRTLNRSRGVPTFGQQLADHMRQGILTGDVAEGEELPSIEAIQNLIDVSRPVVRAALDILEQEGLIVRHPGLRTKVATRPTPRFVDEAEALTRMFAALRAGETLTSTPFAEAYGVDLKDVTYDPITYSEEPASAEDARRLEIEEGTLLLRRRWVQCIIDRKSNKVVPKEIHASAIELSRVRGTAFMEPGQQPIPGGTGAELWALGYTNLSDAIIERTGRPPNGRERGYLRMQAVDWVFNTVRTFTDKDGRPVEVSRTIAPMAPTVFRSRVGLS